MLVLFHTCTWIYPTDINIGWNGPWKGDCNLWLLSFKNPLHLSGWMGLLQPLIHMVQHHGMLESKRHAGTSQTIKMMWTLCLSCPSVSLGACLHEGRRPQISGITGGQSPHLSCKRDQIKMRDYMDRWVTPSKRVTSPTWGPPPPCKQALSLQHCSFVPCEWLAANGLLVLLITY